MKLNTSGIADYIGNKYSKLFDYAKSDIVLHCKNIKNMCGLILKLEKDFYLIMKIMYFINQMTIDWFSCSFFICIKNQEYGAKIMIQMNKILLNI